MLHLQQLESYLEALPKPDHEDPDPDPYFERAPTPVFVPWPLGPAKETQVIILERLPSFASFSFLLLNKNRSFHFILTCGYKCIWWGLCYDLSLAGCIETKPRRLQKGAAYTKSCQIWPGDLFEFDSDVEPMLEVLVGRCLAQGYMDAQEELQVNYMRNHQVNLSILLLPMPKFLQVSHNSQKTCGRQHQDWQMGTGDSSSYWARERDSF